ncbi:MAG: hypothetical protein ACN6OD_00095 [Alcaligenes sp.]
MTEPTQPHGDEPKKVSLKLLLRSKPIAEVGTSIGRIYLYPLRVRDLTEFGNLEPAGTHSQFRNFLSSIGSLTVESDEEPERIPLDPEITKTLSDNEVEQIAEAYVQSNEWHKVREHADRKAVAREDGETASAYLIRLMRDEVEQQHQSAKLLHEKIFGSSSSLFDQVRKSTSALGSTLSEYEQLTKFAKPAPLEIQPIRTDHFDALNRQMAEQARERAEERAEEMALARLTGQMTAESAKTLKDLAEAATTLMEQFDERDRKSDKSTSKQITIAVWSVGISAVLALLALIVSGFAYVQGRDNSSSGDQWQVKLLTAIEQGNQQRSILERENDALREQVKVLDARIVDLEKAQRAKVETEASKQQPDRSVDAINKN